MLPLSEPDMGEGLEGWKTNMQIILRFKDQRQIFKNIKDKYAKTLRFKDLDSMLNYKDRKK